MAHTRLNIPEFSSARCSVFLCEGLIDCANDKPHAREGTSQSPNTSIPCNQKGRKHDMIFTDPMVQKNTDSLWYES